MNSAPQIQSLEISDTELDGVSGGIAPHLDLNVGSALLGGGLQAHAEGTEVSVGGGVLGTFGSFTAGL